jgi:hypothetical protein
MMNLASRSFRKRSMNMDDEDGGMVPPAEHVPTTLTTVMDGPTLTPMTTNQDQGKATIEGEVASR